LILAQPGPSTLACAVLAELDLPPALPLRVLAVLTDNHVYARGTSLDLDTVSAHLNGI